MLWQPCSSSPACLTALSTTESAPAVISIRSFSLFWQWQHWVLNKISAVIVVYAFCSRRSTDLLVARFHVVFVFCHHPFRGICLPRPIGMKTNTKRIHAVSLTSVLPLSKRENWGDTSQRTDHYLDRNTVVPMSYLILLFPHPGSCDWTFFHQAHMSTIPYPQRMFPWASAVYC